LSKKIFSKQGCSFFLMGVGAVLYDLKKKREERGGCFFWFESFEIIL